MKLRILEHSLNEDIEAVKKYYPNIPDDIFMKLVTLDPTYTGKNSLGKYGKWLLNLFNRGKLSQDDFEEVTPLLNQFTIYKNRIQNKDLNSYKSLDDLAELLTSVVDDDSMLTPNQKNKFLKKVKSGKIQLDASNDYDTVYEDFDWVVWIPNTHEASMKLGKGTEWCTAHENPEWYETYTNDDGEEFSLYIMKNKHTGARFQYCDNPYRGYDYQFMNENDEDVDTEEFMADCMESDYDFADWLHNLNPDFFKLERIIDDFIINEENEIVGITDYIEPNVIIPDGVETIGDSAFKETNIKSLYIPNSVTHIDDSAFERSSLQKIDFDDAYSLEYIGYSAFESCDKLDCVVSLPNIQAIYRSAFAYTNITQLYIGNSLVILGASAFSENDNLTYVEIEGSSNSLIINPMTFSGCSNLKEVHLPINIDRIHDTAFANCSKDLTLYTDSQWVKEHIETLNVNLCSANGDEIYIKDVGFVD